MFDRLACVLIFLVGALAALSLDHVVPTVATEPGQRAPVAKPAPASRPIAAPSVGKVLTDSGTASYVPFSALTQQQQNQLAYLGTATFNLMRHWNEVNRETKAWVSIWQTTATTAALIDPTIQQIPVPTTIDQLQTTALSVNQLGNGGGTDPATGTSIANIVAALRAVTNDATNLQEVGVILGPDQVQ